MHTFRDMKFAEQHRQNLETQADNWRKTRNKDEYQPNPALKRNRKKRK